MSMVSQKNLIRDRQKKRILLQLLLIFLVPFFFTATALVYNHTLFLQKLQAVREEVSIPTSEQNAYVSRIRFLSTAIQTSHYKTLSYINDNQKESLGAEITAMEEFTALRRAELEKLRSSVKRSRTDESPPAILLQRLEAEIADLDSKHHEFILDAKSVQHKKIMTLTETQLTEEWNQLHQQVVETASAFLVHNQKEVEESRELTDVLKQNSVKWMYVILTVNIGFLFISIISADLAVLSWLEKIRCRP